MTNPIQKFTEKELLTSLSRLFNEKPENKTALKLMLTVGTGSVEFMAAIVKEFNRREAKQLLPQNHLHNIVFNTKLDKYTTTTTSLLEE